MQLATISSLIDQIEEVWLAKGISQRALAAGAGLSLGTVRAWRQHKSVPGSTRLARLGLTLGLRLELAPSQPPKKRHYRTALPPLRRPRSTYFCGTEEFGLNEFYLVQLIISELATLYDELPVKDRPPMNFTSSRILFEYNWERQPNVESLLSLSRWFGLEIKWMPVGDPWRVRPKIP